MGAAVAFMVNGGKLHCVAPCLPEPAGTDAQPLAAWLGRALAAGR
jgi:hypothetical protein